MGRFGKGAELALGGSVTIGVASSYEFYYDFFIETNFSADADTQKIIRGRPH